MTQIKIVTQSDSNLARRMGEEEGTKDFRINNEDIKIENTSILNDEIKKFTITGQSKRRSKRKDWENNKEKEWHTVIQNLMLKTEERNF